jgi:Tol biopolymer transport system component/DNA-binding winged helix-turn-helix (wHTH) protein
MHHPAAHPQKRRFGGFELDEHARELRRNGRRVRVPNQSIEILIALLAQPGELVTRETLRERLWPADTFVDFEHGLNASVRRLRDALGESAATPRFVETLPRRGYRFIGTLEPAPAADSPQTQPASQPPATREPPSTPAAAPSAHVEHGRRPVQRRAAFWILGLAVAGVVMAASTRSREPRARHPFPDAVLTRITSDAGLQTEPTLSPDGTLVAYGADTAGNFDIWVRAISGGNAVQVTTDASHDWQPSWSPDGSTIAFRSERAGGGIFLVPASGGFERQLTTFGYRPRWSPDGSRLVFAEATAGGMSLSLYVVRRTGGRPVGVSSSLMTARERQAAFAWHPDGQRLVIMGREHPDPLGLLTVDVEGSQLDRWEVTEPVAQAMVAHELSVLRNQAVAWDSHTDTLYFVGQSKGLFNVWSLDADSRTRRIVGGPHRLTTNGEAAVNVALSRDGRRLMFDTATQPSQIWSFDLSAAGTETTGPGWAVTPDTEHAYSPELSPDGTSLIFLREHPGRGVRQELVLRSLATGAERVLRIADKERGEVRGPPLRWSPDGSMVVYRYVQSDSVLRTGDRRSFGAFQQIRVYDLTADSEREVTTSAQVNDVPFGWSLDGREIYSTGARYVPGQNVVARLPLAAAPAAEKEVRVLGSMTSATLWQASVSPDGRWMLVLANDTSVQRGRVLVMPAAGGEWREITDGRAWDDKPRWSADGRLIYFISGRGGLFNVWVVPFDPDAGIVTGEPRVLTPFRGPGKRIYPNIGLMEMSIKAGRLVVPVIHPRGGIWMLESPQPAAPTAAALHPGRS